MGKCEGPARGPQITMQEIGSGMTREIVRTSNVAACDPIHAAAAGQGERGGSR